LVDELHMVGRSACGCITRSADFWRLTPQQTLALRNEWTREGLVVSLVPAHQGITRTCDACRTVAQQDLFERITP
jgi:hypothetical protein